MTKQQFMDEFFRHFTDVSPEEREQITDYYEELICDGLEQGKTEEECVAAFGDPAEAAARFRQESEMAGQNFARQEKGEQLQTYQPNGGIHTVDLKAENLRVELRPVTEPDSPIRILFTPIEERDEVYAEERDGVFYFRHKMKRRILGFGLFFRDPQKSSVIVLEVPTAFEGSLRVQTGNARITMDGLQKLSQTTLITSNAIITVENASSTRLSLKSNNAALELANVGAMELEAVTSNGHISASAVNCPKARLVSSNASLRLEEVSGEEIEATTSNASVKAKNCKSSRKIVLGSSNGSIHFEGCETPDMEAHTSNASVKGTILGDIREYAIESRTSNGSNNLPNIQYPDCTKRLYVKTSNGKIDVQFIRQG